MASSSLPPLVSSLTTDPQVQKILRNVFEPENLKREAKSIGYNIDLAFTQDELRTLRNHLTGKVIQQIQPQIPSSTEKDLAASINTLIQQELNNRCALLKDRFNNPSNPISLSESAHTLWTYLKQWVSLYP